MIDSDGRDYRENRFHVEEAAPHPSHDENRTEAKISCAEIDSGAGVSRLQNEEERVAGRRLHPRRRNLLLPGLRRRHPLHLRHRRENGLLPPGTETHTGGAASGRAALRSTCTEGRTER